MDTQQTITSKAGVHKIGKEVSNVLPKTKDANVNVRDRLNDVLSTEKHNLMNYQIAINEVINDDLRRMMTDNRDSLQGLHSKLFSELFNMGEYQADVVTKAQIQDSIDVFTNYRTQLPYKQQ